MTVYRDDHAAFAARVSTLRADADRLAASVTPAFWRCIPAADAEALRATRTLALDAAAPLDACAAWERHLALFARVLDALDAHADAWRALPDEPPLPGLEGSPVDALDALPDLARAFITQVRALDREARIAAARAPRPRPRGAAEVGVSASLRVDGEPLSLRLAAHTLDGHDATVRALTASTTVPRGHPEVTVRPEQGFESLFHTVRRHTGTGDDRFDSYFRTELPQGEGLALLSAPVRAALLAIARVDVPTLRIAPPEATLRWCYPPTTATLDAAVRCLTLVRRAPTLALRQRV